MDTENAVMIPKDEAQAAVMPGELIVIRQLPIIEERLKEAAESIRRRTEEACSLACTPESVQQVKKVRAELNREFATYENARKAVKQAVSAPYEAFERVYRECISEAYKKADRELKLMVDTVEYHARQKKEVALRAYYDEHLAAAGLDKDCFSFERSGISVLLSRSDKALKAEARRWIEERRADMEAISGMELADEVSAEYKRCLNLGAAIAAVNERREAAERERAAREAREASSVQAEAERAEKSPEPLSAPVKVMTDNPPVSCGDREEKELELHFTVWGTRTKLRALKAFLDEGGYKYE